MNAPGKFVGYAMLGGILLAAGCGTAPPAEAPQPAPSHPSGPIAISRLAPLVLGVPIRDAVLKECDPQRSVPQVVARALGDRAVLVDDASKASGKGLALRIVGLNASPGGGFTGPKFVTVEGKLYDGGSLVGGFTARGSDPYGLGVCVQLGRAIDELAGEIRKWLESPGKDDLLGGATRL